MPPSSSVRKNGKRASAQSAGGAALSKQKRYMRAGITLIEVLIVIAILAGLAGIVFVSLNPADRIEQARDAETEQNADQMTKALMLNIIDSFADPTGITENDVYDICKHGKNPGTSVCVNLDELVEKGYIAYIPVTKEYESDPNISGYEIARQGGYMEICPKGACSVSGGGAGPVSQSSCSEGDVGLVFNETPSLNTWFPNGLVNAIALDGGTTYIGGEFDMVGEKVGNSYTLVDGDYAGDVPEIEKGYSSDLDVVPDGAGGWFVGGHFTKVNGEPADQLVHVLPDGSIDNNWNPVFSYSSAADYVIETLAFDQDTNTLYVGGVFERIDDGGPEPVIVNHLVAFDMNTGKVVWKPVMLGDANNLPSVDEIILTNSAIYVSGGFVVIEEPSGQFNNWRKIAAFDKMGKSLLPWRPYPRINPGNTIGSVWDMHLDGTTLYVAGNFNEISDYYPTNPLTQRPSHIAAFDTTNNSNIALINWDPPAMTNGEGIQAVATGNNTVYVGGVFSTIGGQSRRNLAAFDKNNAPLTSLTSWDPVIQGGQESLVIEEITTVGVKAMVYASDQLFVGGEFSRVTDGGIDHPRRRIAVFDAVGNIVDTYDMAFNRAVNTLRSIEGAPDTVYALGDFTTEGEVRDGLASLDSDGRNLKPWNPSLREKPSWSTGTFYGAIVRSIAVDNSHVYVAGYFGKVGPEQRDGFAVFDKSSGVLTGAAPNPNGTVHAIASDGTNVYVGGSFTSIGGQSSVSKLAKMTTVGAVSALWAPNPDNNPHNAVVSDLLLDGSDLYVAGTFETIGGVARKYLALLDPANGAVKPWDPPDTDGASSIAYLALDGSTLYATGFFTSVEETPRDNFAAFDRISGQLTSWKVPSPLNAEVVEITVIGNHLYAGAEPVYITPHDDIEAYSLACGTELDWHPEGVTLGIGAIVHGSNKLYLGGAEGLFILDEAP